MHNLLANSFSILNVIFPILLIFSLLYLFYSIFKRIKSNIETKRKANRRIIKNIVFIFFLILIWVTGAIFNSTTNQTFTRYFKDNPYETYSDTPDINTKTGDTFRLYRNQKAIIEDLNAYLKYTGSSDNHWSITAIYDFKYLNPKNNKDTPEKDGYCVSQKSGRTVHGISDEYFDFIIYKNEYGDKYSCDNI